MSNQLVPVFQQYFNADGDAEAGLVLHTYIAGTLNDKETFQTYAGTSNTNPIVMNASGYPPAGIYGTGTYRLMLKDSEGTTLRDQDNVVLTEGLQPDADGNYVMPGNLDVQGQMTIDDMVITADGVAIWTLSGSEVMRIDANGNTAYNGATIPAGLDAGQNYIFYSDEHNIFSTISSGQEYNCINCVFKGASTWELINSGSVGTIQIVSLGSISRYKIPSGTASGNFLISAFQTFLEDINGNIAYNGATIPANLRTDYNFEFRGETSIAYNKTNSVSFTCNNCYLLTSGLFDFIDITSNAIVYLCIDGITSIYQIPKSAGNGFSYTIYETRRTDINGNIAYNGTAIPTNLNTVIEYEFRGQDCISVVKPGGGGGIINSTSCYPNSTASSYTATTTGALTILIQSTTGAYTHYKKLGPNVIGTDYLIGTFTATVIA